MAAALPTRPEQWRRSSSKIMAAPGRCRFRRSPTRPPKREWKLAKPPCGAALCLRGRCTLQFERLRRGRTFGQGLQVGGVFAGDQESVMVFDAVVVPGGEVQGFAT